MTMAKTIKGGCSHGHAHCYEGDHGMVAHIQKAYGDPAFSLTAGSLGAERFDWNLTFPEIVKQAEAWLRNKEVMVA